METEFRLIADLSVATVKTSDIVCNYCMQRAAILAGVAKRIAQLF